ncbi:MAG: bifunctional 4-hydroxy-2-oxoglutarate aldolase/2-dehydro-3-deoxy-phosphogluconate aldolase [Chloroflexota bacterium]|nr:bifunctional 4-hydroxy-2-oxoglutarate aldolase/2-dehydro-3-deoxy-phosphogluconate aldolase [Chloroflexota bacterium]MDE3194599.1 bifunctional 4-hydroxy-2-oxoglutarate aldolase/2-dehydro-3-deoxy-phosphogluconate aldolase [Chloroflexota bacterium]
MAITQRPLATRRDLVKIFAEDRIVAVIRVGSPELAERCARTLAMAGVRLIEITLTVPDAFEVIQRLSTDEEIADRGGVIGAGTVLSGRQAEDALAAGARFLVSAILVPDMIAAAHARDAMSMPGTMTPTEVVQAAELGADFVKIFPIQMLGGPAYIAAVQRAIRGIPLVPTGPIQLSEIPDYEKAGVAGYGLGDPFIRPDLIQKREREAAIANIKRFMEACRR